MSKTFTAHGHTWTAHAPGDSMPCKPHARVVFRMRADGDDDVTDEVIACGLQWGLLPRARDAEIIGWRYASQPVEPDELAALLKALQTIYDLTEGSADGAPDASEHDKLCNRIAGICKEVLP